MTRQKVGIKEKLPILETLPLSLQHLTAMFGGTILVPILLGVDPAIALLMNGIGTLIYSYVTNGGIPAYLGSSFAFISPTLLIISSGGNYHEAQSGFIFFGLFFVLMSFIVKKFGTKWIDIVMPPAIMGSVVAIIGLELAPIAVQQSGFAPGITETGKIVEVFKIDTKIVFVSSFTLLIGVFGSVMFRGFLQIIPILTAIVTGYFVALFMGMVDTNVISASPWFSFPHFYAPEYSLKAIAIIAPACLVVLAEHISHLVVTEKVTGAQLMREPGLHKSLLGDGISNVISGFTGSTPNTTYGENIGVMAITRVYSVWVIRIAALLAISFSFIGKISAAISTIPTPVMGGITMLLFGVIAVQGFRIFVDQKVDFSKNRNMVLGAFTFVIGISGASITIGSIQLRGMALAACSGVIFSVLFYIIQKLGLMNENN
jgi:uracil permease